MPAWISNHMHIEVWDEITYPFPNFHNADVEVWESVSNFNPHFEIDVHVITWELKLLGLKLVHVSKRGPCCNMWNVITYPYPRFKSLAKLPSEHLWKITSHNFIWLFLPNHAIHRILLQLLSVGKINFLGWGRFSEGTFCGEKSWSPYISFELVY